jgi:glycerol-3-phosphate O-acyltransferase
VETVEIPIWLLVVLVAMAAWVVLERLFLPSVRWFFRRRVNLVIDRINRRLKLRLPTFSLTKRQVLIERLVYDPQVLAAVREHSESTGAPWNATLARVEAYAREIIPAFNAYFYFQLGHRFARWLVRRLYRVRMGRGRRTVLSQVDPDASVVFVINHRSNMDYLLVTYLAQRQTALSYAAGEWARVWPLMPMVKAMGAYFVRRGSNNPLYRRVLERYVQMAVEGGVVQAVFPEGGLSRDGRFREPRIGLLDYMLRSQGRPDSREIVFVPVCLNYDRVIEDRSLLGEAGRRAERRSALAAIWGTLRFLGRRLPGARPAPVPTYAAAGFGEPLSLSDWSREQGIDLSSLDREERIVQTHHFAEALMERIADAMPVLPVSAVSYLMMQSPGRAWRRGKLERAFADLVHKLDSRPTPPFIPRRNPRNAVGVALEQLRRRHLISADEDGYRIVPGETPLMGYYANAIRHLLPEESDSSESSDAAH